MKNRSSVCGKCKINTKMVYIDINDRNKYTLVHKIQNIQRTWLSCPLPKEKEYNWLDSFVLCVIKTSSWTQNNYLNTVHSIEKDNKQNICPASTKNQDGK